MRIATGGICHETTTFIPRPTTLHDFERVGYGLFRGRGGTVTLTTGWSGLGILTLTTGAAVGANAGWRRG